MTIWRGGACRAGRHCRRCAAAGQLADAGTGFHLEGKPAVDDVFGDASDYRRTVDRFIELATQMQSMRDEFARSVQTTLNAIGAHGVDKKTWTSRAGGSGRRGGGAVRQAHHLGVEYLRVGRELTRHYDQVKEFDRLGESIGLTPDYRWKVKRVLQQYATLLTDYREMKVAFHDQLVDELQVCRLRSAGAACIKGDPQAKRRAERRNVADPGQPGAPGVQVAKNDARARRRLPPNLPSERVPPQSPIPIPKHTGAGRSDGDGAALGRLVLRRQHEVSARQRPCTSTARSSAKCRPATRVGFQAAPGRTTCACSTTPRRNAARRAPCADSYLHEGWTISLRCE